MNRERIALNKLHWYLCALAAFVIILAALLAQWTLYRTAGVVSLTIAIFYVVGSCVRYFLETKIFPVEVGTTDESEESEEPNEGDPTLAAGDTPDDEFTRYDPVEHDEEYETADAFLENYDE